MITGDKVFHFVQGNFELFCMADDFCKFFDHVIVLPSKASNPSIDMV